MAKTKHKVVLYNPRAVFYTMPLALIALASYLDADTYEVVIIDGRTEENAEEAVLQQLKGALCFGTTVLTGAPITDALHITRLVKQHYPELCAVWGGWHPSLFPAETLAETPADAVVRGQGEVAFAEILNRLATGQSLQGIAGVWYKHNGQIVSNAERPMVDINLFPPFNYRFIDFEKYARLSGRNQIDYVASQGCRFRCHFCADPFMYKRGWYGYSPERLANELEELWKTYGFEHVHFQDETFFTQSKRVEQIADEFIKRKLPFSWFATMRADQGARLDNNVYEKCKQSGLERVMIGLESGSQRMLDWMKKDIKIEQVFESAEKCLQHNIAINFSVIIGFPGETEEDMDETMRVVKRLRKLSPEFRVSIFYYKPYPGNEIADKLIKEGYQLPDNIQGWANFDYVDTTSPWIADKKMREIENFKFYQRLAWSRRRPLTGALQKLSAWRCETANYFFPVEKWLYQTLANPVKLS